MNGMNLDGTKWALNGPGPELDNLVLKKFYD